MKNGKYTEDGVEYWYKNDQWHREDGPAVIYPSGAKYWYQHGKLHRLDGPAITMKDNIEYWYVNDKRHRLDGPAVINGNYQSYYINDIRYDKSQWEWIIIRSNLNMIL